MALDVLIVDDEKDICHLVRDILEDEGYLCRIAHTGPDALAEVNKRCPHLVLLDIWLGDTQFDGLKILELIRKDHTELPILMMSGHGNIETAVAAIKKGAYDFLEKPFKSDRLLLLIERALEISRLRHENAQLQDQVTPAALISDVVGTSLAISHVREAIKKHAQTNARVLIQGPFGSGKETIARLIHRASHRANGPFVVLNCSGLNPDELERQLFGCEKEGQTLLGVLEKAHLGTLYLDCVDEMDLEMQLKIARALQRQKFIREGGGLEVEADFRVIASSTDNLLDLVKAQQFKEELYNRLATATINVPPLKERREDIEPLIEHFITFFCKQHQIPVFTVSQEAMVLLKAQRWPGNVRQLKNALEWISLSFKEHANEEDTLIVGVSNLPANMMQSTQTEYTGLQITDFISLPLREARERFERDYLASQVERFEGNISKTAEFIGMERSALHRKLRSLAIK